MKMSSRRNSLRSVSKPQETTVLLLAIPFLIPGRKLRLIPPGIIAADLPVSQVLVQFHDKIIHTRKEVPMLILSIMIATAGTISNILLRMVIIIPMEGTNSHLLVLTI